MTPPRDIRLPSAFHADQVQRWPRDGRHIMAHYDEETIVVYQAYNSAVADYAVKHGQLGGPHFSFTRMSWIKPNFLWMMYRCGWASKENQERVLGLRIGTDFFEAILEAAVPSSFDADLYVSHEDWKRALQRSEVRLQIPITIRAGPSRSGAPSSSACAARRCGRSPRRRCAKSST